MIALRGLILTAALALVSTTAIPLPASSGSNNATIPPFTDPQLVIPLPYATLIGKHVLPNFPLSFYPRVRSFLNVPFARPPVDGLRFRPPVAIDETGDQYGVRDATKLGPECLQEFSLQGFSISGTSEDCLYLNVFTPADVPKDVRLPVMLWIYGGSFQYGGGSYVFYNGPDMVGSSITNNSPVVLVVANYRLGAFGFLASDDLASEGSLNAGLLDQRLAIAWTRRRAHLFNGDGDNLTVFGQSAGAGSVVLHLTANQTAFGDANNDARPVFDRAIVQSGAAGSVGRVEAVQGSYEVLAARANCTVPALRLSCLRAVDGMTFLNISQGIRTGPVVDGGYIPADPSVALTAGTFPRIPVMIGTALNEGTFFTPTTISNASDYDSYVARFGGAEKAVRGLYPLEAYGGDAFQAVADIFNDEGFQCPVRRLARELEGFVPTYKYHWTHVPAVVKLLYPKLGSFHGSELGYIFAWKPWLDTLSEINLSQQVNAYWTSFATFGEPRGTIAWPEFESGTQRRLVLNGGDVGGVSVEVEDERVLDAKCALWDAVRGGSI